MKETQYAIYVKEIVLAADALLGKQGADPTSLEPSPPTR